MATQIEVVNFAKQCVKESLQHIRNAFPEHGKDFSFVARYSTSPRRRRSWGGIKRGVPYISLALNKYLSRQVVNIYEYRHIQHSPVVGELLNVSWKKGVACVIAHEVAHAFTYFVDRRFVDRFFDINAEVVLAPADFRGYSYGRDVKGHGKQWQYVYGILRQAMVNDRYNEIEPGAVPGVVEQSLPRFSVKVHQTPFITFRRQNLSPKGTKRQQVIALIKSIGFTPILVEHVMKELGVTKSNAHAHIYNAKKQLGIA